MLSVKSNEVSYTRRALVLILLLGPTRLFPLIVLIVLKRPMVLKSWKHAAYMWCAREPRGAYSAEGWILKGGQVWITVQWRQVVCTGILLNLDLLLVSRCQQTRRINSERSTSKLNEFNPNMMVDLFVKHEVLLSNIKTINSVYFSLKFRADKNWYEDIFCRKQPNLVFHSLWHCDWSHWSCFRPFGVMKDTPFPPPVTRAGLLSFICCCGWDYSPLLFLPVLK